MRVSERREDTLRMDRICSPDTLGLVHQLEEPCTCVGPHVCEQMDPADQQQQDLVEFEQIIDNDVNNTYKYSSLSTKPAYAQFENVLERPILVNSGVWAVGTVYSKRVNVNSWFANANIASKLAGWSRFRGNFKVIVQLSGSPFHYGELFVRLHPLVKFDSNTQCFSGSYGPPSWPNAAFLQNAVQLSNTSMRPGITMYAGEDRTGEIEWKFTYPHPYIDLVNSHSTLTGKETYLSVELLSTSSLGIVGGTGADINVTVWIQASDVELTGPTIPQSATLADMDLIGEPVGPSISPPKLVASISNDATNVVYEYVMQSGLLDQAADITETVSDAVGCTSTTRKYTRAARNISRALKSIGLCVQTPGTGKVESVNASATAKISSVDLSTAGARSSVVSQGINSSNNPNQSPVDVLDIEALCNREMLARVITWSEANTTGTRLWSFGVTPMIANVQSTAAPSTKLVYTIQYAPMGYIARMFKYWRGDIKFRFKVVASAMHRGKLRLVYNAAGPVDSLPTEGYAVSKIIDLAESREGEFIIPFDSAKAYIDHYTVAHNSFATNQGTGLAYNPAYNGIVSVFVMNELNAPAVNSDVNISVYISGCNMRFGCPCSPGVSPKDVDNGVPMRSFNVVTSETGYVSLQSGPLAVEKGSEHKDKMEDVIFGEHINSLADLIQRSMYYYTQGTYARGLVSLTDMLLHNSTAIPTLPRPLGASSDTGLYYGIIAKTQAGAYDTNLSNVTLFPNYLAYVAPMFLGWKGGVRWTAIAPDLRTGNGLGQIYSMSLEPADYVSTSVASGDYFSVNGSASATSSSTFYSTGARQVASDIQRRTGKGYAYCKDGGVNTAELVLHDYSQLIFNPTRAFWDSKGCGATLVPPATTPTTLENRLMSNHLMVLRTSSTASSMTLDKNCFVPPVDLYVGAADDFRFFHFITVPPVQMCENDFVLREDLY